MRRPLAPAAAPLVAAPLAAALLVTTGCAATGAPAPSASTAPSASAPCAATPAADTGTAAGWLGYLAQHRADVAIVVDDGRGGTLSHRGDEPMPTASMAKLIHVAAFAAEVAAGRIDPDQRVPLADWQRHYVSFQGTGLDGGAHVRALDYLRIPAKDGVPDDPARTVTLDQLADVMVRFSDSAAPDALRDRIGDAPLQRVMDRYGLPGPVPSFQALYERLIASGASTADEVREQAAATYSAPADGFARLIGDLGSGRFGPGAERARGYLEFQHSAPPGLVALGFKGGSLPGVITDAFEGRRADGSVAAGVIMVRGASEQDQEKDARAQLPHQQFLLAAMTDPAVRARLACALG